MKKILVYLSAALLLASCAKDEMPTNNPEESNVAPQIIATMAQEPITRAGVVEDNDYTLAEKFYWTNGDATTVLFKNASMNSLAQYKKRNIRRKFRQAYRATVRHSMLPSPMRSTTANTLFMVFPLLRHGN